MESDIKQLETQLQRTRDELKTGIPLIQQERGTEASEPLKQRLTTFLQKAEPRMSNISQHLVEMTSTVKSTMTMFGEGQSGPAEEDTVTLFFTNLSAFIKAFNQAVLDNRRLLEEQDKAVRKQQEQARMKEQKAARASLLERPNDADVAIDSKGIFADWKKNQSMQADQILNKHKSATGRKGMMGSKLSVTSATAPSGSAAPGGSTSALLDKSTDAAGTRRGRRAGERQRPNIMKDER